MLKRVDWKLSFLAFAILWAALEVALRLAAGPLWANLPHGAPLSPALLKDRLDSFARLRRGKKLCVALGDSVFYGTALRAHGVPGWEGQTPTAWLRRDLPPGWVVLDLSGDGLNPMDLLGLLDAAAPLKPDAVVVELNQRMLAPDAAGWPGCMAHPWLDRLLPAGLPRAPAEPTQEKRAFARLREGLTRVSAAARYAEFARDRLFQPSAQDVYASWVKALMPGDEEAPADLILRMKIEPYYASPAAPPGHLGRRALAALAAEIRRLDARGYVFLTPQNMALVSPFLDRDAFRLDRAAFKAPFQAAGVRYADLAGGMPTERFLDHCHLDPAGNRSLALEILAGLKP